MKKILSVIFFIFPLVSHAQITAPTANATRPTSWLTGKQETVFIFFDNNPIQLTAQHSSGENATFTWTRLDVAGRQLVPMQTDTGIVASTLSNISEGGYQVMAENAANLIDTFTTWIFRDTLCINDIVSVNECEALRLEAAMTPTMNARYTIYNFPSILATPSIARDSSYQNQRMTVQWTSNVNIHEGVQNPDESWRTRAYTLINNPPPLKTATYKVEITDIFGKIVDHTTPNAIPAIAAYAKITAESLEDNIWQNLCEQAGSESECTPKGEALYRIRFTQKESINSDKYDWKGFGSNTVPNGERSILWEKTIQNADEWVVPQVSYKGTILDGYTPGNYKVRLIAYNAQSGCIDSTEIKYVEVEPSKFNADAIPNAFTPNNDGQNDIFTFVKGQEPVSLEYVNIYIYNRSGHLVYRYEGRADAWQGWNGKMLNTGNDVADGTYFYVINGEGWDGVLYNSSQYKGNVTIFR